MMYISITLWDKQHAPLACRGNCVRNGAVNTNNSRAQTNINTEAILCNVINFVIFMAIISMQKKILLNEICINYLPFKHINEGN